MDWSRYSNPIGVPRRVSFQPPRIGSGVCPIGPDAVLVAPPAEIAAESWGRRLPNQREQITYPAAREGQWVNLYVRTALIRPRSWREGARGPVVKSAARAAEILAHVAALDHERVVMLLLDERWKLMAIHEAAVGGLHGCALTARDIVRVPVLVGASRVVMAHNHPSGDPTPSMDDVRMTEAASAALDAVGVGFVDHLTLSRASGQRSITEYASTVGNYRIRAQRFPPGADRVVVVDPPSSEQLALAPYGKLARFVVRTAMIESNDRASAPRHSINSFDDLVRVPAVQALADDPDEALLTLCVNARNDLIAVHVTRGAVHGIAGAQSIFGVAATVPTSAVFLAHNHPRTNGRWREDRAMTADIRQGLDPIGITLFDHVVVTEGRFESVAN